MTKLNKTKLKIQVTQNPLRIATFHVSAFRLREMLRITNLQSPEKLSKFLELIVQAHLNGGADAEFIKFRIEKQTECFLSCEISNYIDCYLHTIEAKEKMVSDDMQSVIAFTKREKLQTVVSMAS